MLEEIQQGRNKFTIKIYLALILCLTLVIVPLQELKRVFEYNRDFNAYTEIVARGPVQQSSEIQLNNLYPLLSRNPFRGTWQSSIKRSQYLQQESGRIQVRTIFNQSQQVSSYNMKISIFDGWYLDNKHYEILLNAGSIKVKQRFQPGKILYQTVTPLLSYYHQGEGFKVGSQKSLFINKLKLKIFVMSDQNTKVNSIKLELLISSEYSINVIGRQIYEYQETLHDGFLSILLMVQLLIQGYGIYFISETLLSRKESPDRYSKTGFLLSIAIDFTQAIGLTFIGFLSRKKVAIFSLPILTSWVILIVIQLRILTILFHQQFRQNSLKLAAKIYGFFSLVCLFSYIGNFSTLYFILFSLSAMFPQIYNNYMVGHNLKQVMKYFLMYILPRYLLIPYIRLYHYNVFGFQPNWFVCLICLIIILFQTMLIFLQIRYGVRSIIPKFLHPEQLKYFLSETDSQDDICSICLVSIKQKAIVQPSEQTGLPVPRQQLQNNIVLTPCRHKFHIQCLAQSMKNKSECPNCRCVLPPLQQYH